MIKPMPISQDAARPYATSGLYTSAHTLVLADEMH